MGDSAHMRMSAFACTCTCVHSADEARARVAKIQHRMHFLGECNFLMCTQLRTHAPPTYTDTASHARTHARARMHSHTHAHVRMPHLTAETGRNSLNANPQNDRASGITTVCVNAGEKGTRRVRESARERASAWGATPTVNCVYFYRCYAVELCSL